MNNAGMPAELLFDQYEFSAFKGSVLDLSYGKACTVVLYSLAWRTRSSR